MRKLFRNFRLAGHYRRASFVILLASVMVSILNTAMPLVYLVIFNQLIPTQDDDLLFKTKLIAMATTAFLVLFYFLLDQFASNLRASVTAAIRGRFVARTLDFKFEFFQKNAVGDIVQRLIPELDSLGISLSRAFYYSGSFLEIALLVSILAVFNRAVLGAYAVFALGNLAWMSVLKKFIVRKKLALGSTAGRIYDRFFQVLLGIKQIKCMNLNERQIAEVRGDLWEVRQETAKAAMLDSALAIGPVLLFKTSFLIGMVLSFISLKTGGISLGVFIWTMFLMYRMGKPFEDLAAFAGLINSGVISAKRVSFLQATSPENSGPARFPGLSYGIEFQSVSFWYAPGKPILQDINLTIAKGADVALVGESGSGKTSLIGLLLRINDVKQGSLRLDNRDISEFQIRSLREKIGIVSQDIFLFNDSIGRNIDIQGRLSRQRILEICDMCQLSDLLSKSESGLETRVGERGMLISGGEKQRIAIARLIAKGADIIIFDEASSSLDPRVERSIRDMILDYRRKNPSVTTITISHRVNAIAGVDSIFVLKNGRVAEQGSHGDLVSKRSHYYNLFAESAGR